MVLTISTLVILAGCNPAPTIKKDAHVTLNPVVFHLNNPKGASK